MQLSGKLREAMEGRQSAENSLAAMAQAREADMTEREAITDNSRLLQSKIEKYGVLMSTLDFNPWETPSKVHTLILVGLYLYLAFAPFLVLTIQMLCCCCCCCRRRLCCCRRFFRSDGLLYRVWLEYVTW